jgi:hypothetical protein
VEEPLCPGAAEGAPEGETTVPLRQAERASTEASNNAMIE